MDTLEKGIEKSTETNCPLDTESTETSSDTDEYLSCEEEINFPVLIESSEKVTLNKDEGLPVQKKNEAQSPLTENQTKKKSDQPEQCRFTVSEQTAKLLEKISHIKGRANKYLEEIYSDIKAFADDKNGCLFSDLQKEIDVEFGNVQEVCIEKLKDVRDDSCPIVITGETSAGKSTFINLLLGVELLPHSALACTSTICRIHNSKDKKIIVTGSKKIPQEIPMEENITLESVRKVLKRYVTVRELDDDNIDTVEEEEYEFVDIFWPIPVLQENIIIVDTPGIGPDHPDLTKRLFQYLPNALAFVYVLNASNAGGVQSDRILKVQDQLLRIRQEEKKTVFDPRRAVFICNKWDLIYEDDQEVFNFIHKMLKKTWYGFETDKLLKLSARKEIQSKGKELSDNLRDILSSIEKMLPATVEEKIRRHLQWQQNFFDRVLLKLSTRIRNTYRSKEENLAMVKRITKRVQNVKTNQSTLQTMLYTMAEEKCGEICLEIFNHLRKKDVFSKMFDWSKDQLPGSESMDDNKKVIDIRIADMVTAEIMSKMKRIEIESLSNFVKELFEWQQLAIGRECGELDRVFHGETNVSFTFDEHKIESLFSLPKRSFTPEEKAVVVVSSPIWIPAVLLVGAVSISIITPAYGVKKLMNRYENKKRIAQYNRNRTQYANERAEKYLKTITFDNLLYQIQNGILKNIKERIDRYFSDVIPKRIAAGELLIENIERDMRPPCEIRKLCHKVEMEVMSVYGRIILAYTDIFDEKLIPLPEVRTSLTESLNLNRTSQAELRHEEQWIPVHVSTIKYAVGNTEDYTKLAELNIMRKCKHQNIVTLYGFSAGYGTPGKSFHVFTELCDKTLEDEILNGGKQSSKSRQRYLEDALKGILYLHQNGIVHKNIRLGTILIKGNEAKLSSCGITKDIAKRTDDGFPIIRAPEFYKESYCGCEADVFQVGIVIWEAWYCKRAFFETENALDTDEDLIKSIVEGERPSFLKPLPQPSLIDVINSCWKSDPDERPSADIVLSELLKNFTNLQATDAI